MTEIATLLADPTVWVALVTLIVMEVVLGIDNLLFISIITNKLPEEFRDRARKAGIMLALVMRLVLLAGIAWIVQLSEPIFEAFGHGYSVRDLILIAGGLFLVWKATKEIHHNVDPEEDPMLTGADVAKVTFGAAIGQIILLDLVFSIDSIITAVGMTEHLPVMVTAVLVAVLTMLLASGPLSRFVAANPTVVMLVLSFLLMIGMTLIAEGMGFHVPKGYVYGAMAFSAFVEFLNVLARQRRARIKAARG